MTEEAFTEWQNQTRQEALEKEVKRLRERSYTQSGKIGSLRRTVYFTYFFFIVLFTILFLKGMISFPDNKNTSDRNTLNEEKIAKVANENKTEKNTATEENLVYIPDTVPVPIKETKGTIYCVQIGAYTGISLDEFKGNMVSLQQDSYEGINQLTLGRFRDYDKAMRFLSVVQQIGFHDAFIMSFRNGRRVPLQEMQAVKQPEQPVTKQPEQVIPYIVPEEKPIVNDTIPPGNGIQ